ncbi:MAG TPA: hypothetical protein VJQ61_06820 [Sinomonas sp.]|nr:hypothetical protein [Sinomonas sp.]
MNEFWTQVFSGIVATVVGTVLSTLILTRTRRERWKPAKVVAKNGRGGTQVIVGDSAEGDVNVDVDNSRQIVVQNIAASPDPGARRGNSADGDQTWLLVVGAVIAAGLFVTYHQVLFWLMVGFMLGLLITLATAMVRTSRHGLWSSSAVGAVCEVLLSLGTAGFAAVSVATIQNHGRTLDDLSQQVAAAQAANRHDSGPVGTVISAMVDPALQLIKIGLADGQLTFALVLLGASIISSLIMIRSWGSLFDWLAYVGFVFGRSASKGMAKRAYRFEERTWKAVAMHAVLCAIACLLASGWLVMLTDLAARTGAPTGAG